MTRYVDKYIESLCIDVVTPLDLVNEINHVNDMKRTVAELYEVEEDNMNIQTGRKEKRTKESKSTFQIIGCCSTLEYLHEDGDEDVIYAYARS